MAGLKRKYSILIGVFLALFLLPVIAFLAYFFWPKQKFIPITEPTALILANPDRQIEILKQPLKKEMLQWSNRQIAALPVEGLLRVDYKGKDYLFIQLTCPAQLQCTGAKAYVPLDMAYSFGSLSGPFKENTDDAGSNEASFFIVPDAMDTGSPTKLATLRAVEYITLRDWLRNPRQPTPGLFDQDMIEYYLAGLNDSEQEQKVAEWFFLSKSYTEKMRNPAFESYIAKYGDYKKIHKVLLGKDFESAGLRDEQDVFLKELAKFSEERFGSVIDRYFDEMLAMSGQGLTLKQNMGNYASNFNSKLHLPLFKEFFFSKILKQSNFKANLTHKEASPFYQKHYASYKAEYLREHNLDAEQVTEQVEEGKFAMHQDLSKGSPQEFIDVPEPIFQNPDVIFDYEFGAILKWTDARGKQHESIIEEISAKSYGTAGLGFIIKTAELAELEMVPQKLAAYFGDLDSDRLKRFKQQIGSVDEVYGEQDFRRRALLLAIKVGKNQGYNEKERRQIYELSEAQYWQVLRLMKSHQSIDVLAKDIYKGHAQSNSESSELTWFQTYDKATKYSTLSLAGKAEVCMRDCFSENISVQCYGKQSTLEVSFPAGVLTESDQNSEIHLIVRNHEKETQWLNHCSSVWNEIAFHHGDDDYPASMY